MKKKLEEVSNLKNVVNRNLSEDLKYEKDIGERLKEDLKQLECEKD